MTGARNVGPIELQVNNRAIERRVAHRVHQGCAYPRHKQDLFYALGPVWLKNTVAAAHLQEVRSLANLQPCVDSLALFKQIR